MSQSNDAVMKRQASKTAMQKILDTIERVGNAVHLSDSDRHRPFAYFVPLGRQHFVSGHQSGTDKVEAATTAADSLLTADGIATSTPGSFRISWASPRSAC